MRTYNERLANIKAKAKANQRAKRTIAVSLVSLSVFVLLICSLLFWPEMLFEISNAPTVGPVLEQPTNGNVYPMATMPMAPSAPAVMIEFESTNLKLRSGEAWGWGPFVIGSVEELELFCSRQSAQYNEWPESLAKPSDNILDHVSKYDDAFFAKQSLILLMKPEGSGSNRLEVTDVFGVGDAVYVTIDRILPEIGTDDMAYWYMFIETDQRLADDTDVFVQYKINGDQWQKPASHRNEIPIQTQQIHYGAPDMDGKYPKTEVIASVEEWEAFCFGLKDRVAEVKPYDAAFFETNTLIALWNPVGSSSEKYTVSEVNRWSDGSISIHVDLYVPEVHSEDVMSWLLLIEAEAEISHYAKITVEYETVAENITPAPDTPEEPLEQNFDLKQLLGLIPADIQEQICQDFNDKFVHFPVYDWEPDVSLRVFGIFGDAYALFVDGHLAYSDVLTSETVCGVTFRYPSTQTMYVYADGQFYSLQEAYDAQMITYEDILAIYKNYKSAYPVYYE